MATHQDLLDAINRVRTATGNRDAWQNGLSGDDIAAACNPFSSPAALGGVLTRIIAAHPDAFLAEARPTGTPPRTDEGLAAQAIRNAETALAQQKSSAAQVDLQVVSAVLNAQSANAVGAAELDRLQREIEAAVLSRSDLDTPAGAREFQRFLIGKLREIRTVVDTAGLDATSKAALVAALASLYACATPEPGPPGERREAESAESPPTSPRRGSVPPEPGDWAQSFAAADLPSPDSSEDLLSVLPEFAAADAAGLPWDAAGLPLASAYQGAPQAPYPGSGPPPYPVGTAPASAGVPAMAPLAPAWGGGSPFGGGPPGWPDFGSAESFRDFGPSSGADGVLRDHEFGSSRRTESVPGDPGGQSAEEKDTADESAQTAAESAGDTGQDTGEETGQDTGEETGEEAPHAVELPDGQMIIAATPQIAAAMTAALAGTPVADAFRQQGIGLPQPGSPVTAPLDAATLAPGDIGVFTDRYALALGNGTALLDNQIQPIPHVAGPGFLGWQHPPGPTMTTPQLPAAPASTRPPAATAPS